jgi:hypothetical protein
MAYAIKKTQSDDGFWRTSMLEPDEFPDAETSGTVLFVLGLEGDLDAIAMDEAGKALFWEQNLVERKRAKRRKADKNLPVSNGIIDDRNPGSLIEHLGKEKLS